MSGTTISLVGHASRTASVLVAVAVLACTTPTPGAPRSGERTASPDATAGGRPKTLTIGQINSIKGYGPWAFSSTPGGGASLVEIHTVGLVSEDVNGSLEPRVATKIPSFDDGSIVVLPDGRMQTTWKLRPEVKWHNGEALVADDFVLGWEVARHPETQSSSTPAIRYAENVQALDPRTLSVTWKSPFYKALDLGHRDLWPYPKSLLAEAFQGDKQVFMAHPYFTTEYVHLGPFRLVDFGLGERQVFERFDEYFLGRPKVGTIVLRTIADANAMVANFRAGTVDIIAEKVLPADLSIELRDEWRRTGAGILVERQDNWLRLAVQFDPRWSDPPELSRDVRIRRGLLQAIDRDAMREFVLPGFADTSGDTFMRKGDPRAQVVGYPFARYPHDPTRAAQQLADAGWRRAPDGRLVTSEGTQVRVEVRAFLAYAKDVAIVADFWRQLGIDVSEVIPTATLSRDVEWRATFPGFDAHERGYNDQMLVSFDSRLHALAENRWQGANTAHYVDLALDRLIDQLYGTVDVPEQGRALKEVGEVLASDLPILPLYFRTSFAAVGQGIHALTDDYGGTQGSGAMARRAHLWDRG